MTKTQQKKLNVKTRRRLLRLWSTKGRENAICFLCGTTERLQAHHMFEKKFHKALRYDIANRCILCASCHRFKGATVAGGMHSSPKAVMTWIKANNSSYAYLCANMGNTIDYDDLDVLERVEECIEKAERYWN